MYGGIRDGLLNMTCDVYVQQKTQDADHGGIIRAWKFDKKITCHVDIISSIGSSTPDNNKEFGFLYLEEEKLNAEENDWINYKYPEERLFNRLYDKHFINVVTF